MSQMDPTGLYRLHSSAKTRGGICFARKYRGLRQKYHWRCSYGHTWWARGDHIVLRRSWCPECVDYRNLPSDGLDKLQAAAALRGGECLSTRYDGLAAIYRWRCENGHKWHAVGSGLIFQGTWCQKCRVPGRPIDPKRLSLLQEAAADFGGECLSDSYHGMRRHYRWRCARGHEWQAQAEYVVGQRQWCARCRAEDRAANSAEKHDGPAEIPGRVNKLKENSL